VTAATSRRGYSRCWPPGRHGQAHSVYNEPDVFKSKDRARSRCISNNSSNSDTSDCIHSPSHLPNIESSVSLYQYLDLGYRQNDMVLHKITSPFNWFTLMLDRSCAQLVIIDSPLSTTTGNVVTSQQPRRCLMCGDYLGDIHKCSCDVERGIGDARRSRARDLMRPWKSQRGQHHQALKRTQ
jgi:hypothetical protein